MHLGQITSGLPTGGLEQIAHLPIDLHWRACFGQHHKTDQFITHLQGHDQPQLWIAQQPRGQQEIVVALREGPKLVQVDDPALGSQKAGEGGLRRLTLGSAGQVPMRRLIHFLATRGQSPQTTCGTLQHVRQAADHQATDLLRRTLG